MTSRVGPKGQVVIPKQLRDALGIRPGDEVDFALEGERLTVMRIGDWRSLEGTLAPGALDALERDHHDERASDARRWP